MFSTGVWRTARARPGAVSDATFHPDPPHNRPPAPAPAGAPHSARAPGVSPPQLAQGQHNEVTRPHRVRDEQQRDPLARGAAREPDREHAVVRALRHGAHAARRDARAREARVGVRVEQFEVVLVAEQPPAPKHARGVLPAHLPAPLARLSRIPPPSLLLPLPMSLLYTQPQARRSRPRERRETRFDLGGSARVARIKRVGAGAGGWGLGG
jgi:hypothetical protein